MVPPDDTNPQTTDAPTKNEDFLGIPARQSFFLMLILFILSYALGGLIYVKAGGLDALLYFAYWLPCTAALLFGVGAAYRPALKQEKNKTLRFIYGFTDKGLFEGSAFLLYLGLVFNIHASACSWPSSELFVLATIITASIFYIHGASRRNIKTCKKLFLLSGGTIIAGLAILLLVLTYAEIKRLGFDCHGYAWRYRY